MKSKLPIPAYRALKKLGSDISDARRRRRIGMALMSERCGFSRLTLSKIEKGQGSVSMSAYASALFVLGMHERLADIADASHDLLGLDLYREQLPQRIRKTKSKLIKEGDDK